MAKQKALTEEEALAWLENQVIQGVERDSEFLRLNFTEGYFEVDSNGNIYVETKNPTT